MVSHPAEAISDPVLSFSCSLCKSYQAFCEDVCTYYFIDALLMAAEALMWASGLIYALKENCQSDLIIHASAQMLFTSDVTPMRALI